LDDAIAAMFEATGFVEEDAVGVLVLMDEAAPPAALVVELTSCPPDVGNAAEAPEGAEVEVEVAGAAEVAAVAGAAVDPRSGTAAGAPVEPTLM
jgi:hypothetical protein